jgi:N-6 DNA Methylase
MPKDAAFWQFLYLIFAKIRDEQRPGEPLFYAYAREPFEEEGRKRIRERIDRLFAEVKDEYGPGSKHPIFRGNEEITLSLRALGFLVSELARYDLINTDIDAKGIAYQELVGTNLRGDRGQYFTPRGAVRLMVEILDPQEGDRVLDPACGTGGWQYHLQARSGWRRDLGRAGRELGHEQERTAPSATAYPDSGRRSAGNQPEVSRVPDAVSRARPRHRPGVPVITAVEAYQYRCFSSASVEFGAYNVLAGPNGSGKTLLLDIPTLLGDLIAQPRSISSAFLELQPGRGARRAQRLQELIHGERGNYLAFAIEAALPDDIRRTLAAAQRARTDPDDRRAVSHLRYEVRFEVFSADLHVAGEYLYLYPASRPPERGAQWIAERLGADRMRRRGWVPLIHRDPGGPTVQWPCFN